VAANAATAFETATLLDVSLQRETEEGNTLMGVAGEWVSDERVA